MLDEYNYLALLWWFKTASNEIHINKALV